MEIRTEKKISHNEEQAIDKKSFSIAGKRIEVGITGNWTGLDVSPVPLIRQLIKNIKIR